MIKFVPERLPNDALSEDKSMVVDVLIHVAADGKVAKVDVLSTKDPRLSDPIVEAMLQWVFSPKLRDGTPVEWSARQHYQFGIAALS